MTEPVLIKITTGNIPANIVETDAEPRAKIASKL